VVSDTVVTRPPPGAHAKIVAIYDYWRRIAPGPGLLPGRRHLDPVDIPKLLPNVWLIDVVGMPRRFRARLIGTTLQRSGLTLKPGAYVEDPIRPELREKVLSEFRFVAESGQPLWFRGAPKAPHDTEIFELERIYLPLAADGATVDMLLNLSVLYKSAGEEW
jgi:PAS domain